MKIDSESFAEGRYLLPYKYKYLAYSSFILGLILFVIRFIYGIKLAILNWNVFAIYSSFFDTKIFTMVQNNMSEEITLFFLLIGLNFLIITREKKEFLELQFLRLKIFVISLIINLTIMLIANFTIYGLAFLWITFSSLVSFQIIYILIFQFAKIRLNQRN
jgi:hypothetical protein